MELVLKIISHPLLISLTSVCAGTGIIGLLNYRRVRRDAIRDKSLEFIEETSIGLNRPISMLYHHIRTQETKISQQLWDASGANFQMRLSVRVKGESFLGNPSFPKAFDQITHNLRYIMEHLEKIPNNPRIMEFQTLILERVKKLSIEWDLPFVESQEGLAPPYHALITWLDLVWARVVQMLNDGIDRSLGRKKKRKVLA